MRIGLGLQVGRVRGRSNVDAVASDTTPNAFTFTDVVGSEVSTVNTSNTITVTGIDTTSPISITGGTYSVNGGAYTASAGTVSNGNTVTVQVTSSASAFTDASAVLTIGGVSDTYTVRTLGAELITNGTGTDATGWTLANVSILASQGTAAGQFQLTTTVASTGQTMSRNAASIVSGQTYKLSATVRAGTAEGGVYIVGLCNAATAQTAAHLTGVDTVVSTTLTADAAFLTIFGQIYSDFTGRTGFLDNISVRRVS